MVFSPHPGRMPQQEDFLQVWIGGMARDCPYWTWVSLSEVVDHGVMRFIVLIFHGDAPMAGVCPQGKLFSEVESLSHCLLICLGACDCNLVLYHWVETSDEFVHDVVGESRTHLASYSENSEAVDIIFSVLMRELFALIETPFCGEHVFRKAGNHSMFEMRP